jgi:hypothetical protein
MIERKFRSSAKKTNIINYKKIMVISDYYIYSSASKSGILKDSY